MAGGWGWGRLVGNLSDDERYPMMVGRIRSSSPASRRKPSNFEGYELNARLSCGDCCAETTVAEAKRSKWEEDEDGLCFCSYSCGRAYYDRMDA